MLDTTFDFTPFYLASPLAERPKGRRPRPAQPPGCDVELASFRLQEWRQQFARNTGLRLDRRPDADRILGRRLEAGAVTQEEFLTMIGEAPEEVARRFPGTPPWLQGFADRMFSVPPDRAQIQEIRQTLAGIGSSVEGAAFGTAIRFLSVIEPLLAHAALRLRSGARAVEESAGTRLFDPETVHRLLLPAVSRRLLTELEPTLVLELNVARLRGELDGATPEERFESWIARLHDTDFRLRLFQEYPVLARLVATRLDQWVAVNVEMLARLCRDGPAIAEEFHQGLPLGRLVAIRPSLGDPHRGGRTVTALEFDSGFRIVYKPRSLASDVHFAELVEWLNERGVDPPLRPLRVLDRGDHGWAEFIEVRPCQSAEELERYHLRCGAYLAVLHALHATDFHYENVLADGEHPVLVDGETLLHAQRRPQGVPWKAIFDVLLGSVLRIGLLPGYLGADDEYEGYDLGGLSGRAGQFTVIENRVWEARDTDRMHASYRRLRVPAGQNLPTLHGEPVHLLDYREPLEEGFTRTYRLLMRHKRELLADGGPIDRFAADPVRFLRRATRTYVILLHKATHPDFMRDAVDRDRLFDQLWSVSEGEEDSVASHMIPYEIDELHQGVIPVFTVRPDSRDLWTGAGQRIPGFLDESCLTQTRRKVENLSEADLDRQLWFLRCSVAGLVRDWEHLPPPADRRTPMPPTRPDRQAGLPRDQLIAEATRIGERLSATAVVGDGARWFGMNWVVGTGGRQRLQLGNAGEDLYNGAPGILLFLAYLAELTGDRRFEDLVGKGLISLREIIEDSRDVRARPMDSIEEIVRPAPITGIGLFGGLTGVVYMAAHLHRHWPGCIDLDSALSELEGLIAQDPYLDVIGGAAGAIAALLAWHTVEPSDRTLGLALACGDHLLGARRAMTQGAGWPRRTSGQPASGFGHGAAGIGWALLRLAEASGDERFRQAALEGLEFERSLFAPERGNWSFSAPVGGGAAPENAFGCAWCRGAPGIGLARVGALRHLEADPARSEIEVAVETTLAEGFGRNHSLCHGDLGNLELLLKVAGLPDGERWRSRLEMTVAAVVADIRHRGWVCGINYPMETPGLMNGLAGIGYGLLRLAEPERVPSVLLAEPPRRPRR